MIQLSYDISPNRRALTVLADDAARSELLTMREEDPDAFGNDSQMWEAFESLICNSELSWVRPEECGDLTDAPILGIRYHEDEGKGEPGEIQPPVERWGYMDYQVRSPLQDLLNKGCAVFVAP